MKKLISLLLVLFLAACASSSSRAMLSTPTAGRSFYVATTGIDTNPCSLTAPCKTIQKGAGLLAAGDTLFIRGGTYLVPGNAAPIRISASGTSASWITVKAYPGETPVIKGDYGAAGNSAWYGILIPGTSYITIDGLTIKGFHVGVTCQAPGHNIVIQNNTTIFNSEAGISSANTVSTTSSARGCDFVTIQNNIVHDNGYYETGLPATGYYMGGGSGITMGAQGYAHYAYSTDFSFIHSYITGNVVYHNFDGTGGSLANPLTHTDGNGIIADMTQNGPPIMIANNIIYGNGGKCIQIFGSQNIWVVGNTCYQNATDQLNTHLSYQGEITGWASKFPLKNIHITNNIVYALQNKNVTFFPDAPAAELTIQGNNWYSGIYRGTYSPKGTGFILTDPLFTNPSDGDFSLQPNSPACGMGALACVAGPTITPTTIPTVAPSLTPTLVATSTQTSLPTATKTLVPTSTFTPSSTSTSIPTFTPTWTPTSTQTDTPTSTPAWVCVATYQSNNQILITCERR